MSGVNGFAIGQSFSLQIVTPNGQLSIPVVTKAERKAVYAERTSVDIGGNVKHIPIPQGWSGSFDLDVTDGTVDNFIAAIETGYYLGQGIQSSTITETVTYPNGAVSQFLYSGVQFTLAEGGTISGDDKVSQKLDWKASKRIKLV